MIKKIKPSSPDIYLGKTIADNTLARIAHVNQLADQINNELAVVKPYKVYTAFITQGDVNEVLELDGDGGPLVKGVTYLINVNPLNADLTIYGAPNNLPGTYFVANQNVVTLPYTYDLQLFYNLAVPVVTVLENTLGNIYWSYAGVGTYYANSDSGAFTLNKTTSSIDQAVSSSNTDTVYYCLSTAQTVNTLRIMTFLPTYDLYDEVLTKRLIEIRVYS
jgi:hypothetical protein